MKSQNVLRRKFRCAVRGIFALVLTVLLGAPVSYSAPASSPPPSPIPLSDTPLVLVTPAHPQVLMLLGNSQSMDGNLSGAIMTGAPGTYSVFAGFTPPKQGPDAAGNAPYTVTISGVQYDNSDSRLNVAKEAIQQTLTSYQAVTDFGLMDLGTSGSPALYTTWVYFMSQPGGFTFTSTAGSNTYANPCYNIGSNPYRISSADCNPLVTQYGNVATSSPYFVAAQTSDAPSVNDVLYAGGGLPTVFVSYDGPYKGFNWGGGKVAGPYPPTFSLSDYNNGNVLMGYRHLYGYSGSFATGPTNAGYVPFSDEVMYAKRGFGYYNNVTNSGNLLVGVAPDSASRRSTFTSLLAPETNQSGSGEIKSNAVNAALAGMLQSAYGYYTGGSAPPSNNGCTPKRYVVLITDGLPTVDLDGKAWPPLGSDAAAGYNVSATFDPSTGALASTNDQALQDTVDQIAALKKAGIDTYVVGMGAGVDPTKNAQAAASLKAMAVAGGTNDYFAATTPTQVAADLRVILTQIQSNNLATTSAAVDSTSLNTTTAVYQSRFNPSDTPYNDWTGNLLAFPIAPDGTVNTAAASAIWNAQQLLDTKAAGGGWDSARAIATYNPVSSKGVPFRWADISSSGANNQQSLLMTSATDTLGPARLNYLRGDTSQEVRNGGTFRNRSHILGDIVDSDPLFIGAPNGPYQDASYQAFKTAQANRTPVIYVGANDGMLHAFNASTNPSIGGREMFAFVPNGVFDHLISLTDSSAAAGHRFYVDGSPTAGDVLFSNGTWHSIVVGGLNNGGNSIYALDVTNPSAMTTESGVASNVLWEFTDSDMGQSYSRPQVARVNSSSGTRFVVVFGSGYNNSSQRPYLYFVDAQKGTLVAKLDLCQSQPSSVCDLTKPNGLASPTVVSLDGTGLVTRVYVGDLQGNMWKVDVSSSNPAQWSATPLFKAQDASGTPQPITTAPTVSLHPNFPAKSGLMVYFGTGQFLGPPDITTTNPQTFYGIWDNSWPTMPTRSDLVQQTISVATVSTPIFNGSTQVRLVSQNPMDWNSKKGWYIDLPTPGERSITDSRLLGGRVIFTTYIPSSNVCSGGGQSWLMVLDFANGGALTKPEIDLNGDNKLDMADTAGGAVPGGIPLGQGYASAPTIVKGKQGDNGDSKLLSRSTGAIDTVKERGGFLQGRLSWRQLQ